MSSPFAIVIVARDRDGGIGKSGDLPWHLPGDLAFFQEARGVGANRGQNAVVMGRKTWESIPPKYRPLSERYNVVVTRQTGYEVPGRRWSRSLPRRGAGNSSTPGRRWAGVPCGGGTLYAEALRDSRVKTAWITEIDAGFECDTFFPELPAEFHLVETRPVVEENGTSYRFVRYEWAGSAV